MTIEDRIKRLENKFPKPYGTQIVRQLTPTNSRWSLALGQFGMPKTFFTGETITDAIKKAEKAIL